MKVIFLDMDGVMNDSVWVSTFQSGLNTSTPGAYYEEESNKPKFGDREWWIEMINPAAVSQLNRIIEATGAKVVISSTWRLRHSPEEMQALLEARGFIGEVIDKTPRSHETPVRLENGEWFGPQMSLPIKRGHEIDWWLFNHPEVTKFVILDDDSDMVHLSHRHVKTHWAHWERYPEGELGLGPVAADRAIALLNEDET